MSEKARVSFIVPSFNYAHLIERCIESIIGQTYRSWELIICDDQSSDNSVEVLTDYTTHPQIQIYLNERQLGLYENVIRCISYAKGDYIKILMADDWLHPDYLKETLRIYEQYPTAGLCSVRTEVFDNTGRCLALRMEPEEGRIFYPRDVMLSWTTRVVNPIGNPSRVIFRREAYEATGGFDLAIEYCTESELWIRMLEDWDCGFVPKILSYELLHSRNATKDYVSDARHLTTGEQMYAKLFTIHSYYRGNWWRQQLIWLLGWREYWMVALRHMLEGQYTEITILTQILQRRVPIVFWLPLMVWRLIQVILKKITLKVRYG